MPEPVPGSRTKSLDGKHRAPKGRPGVDGGDLGIADRTFWTTRFRFGVRARRGCFLVRQHQSTGRWAALRPWHEVGRVVTGFVQHPMIRGTAVDGDGVRERRRIRLPRDPPTRDKATELLLLTNRPPEDADALLRAETYRRRGTLEPVFPSRTEACNCAVHTRAAPQAAGFGFGVALGAYHVLAVLRAALRSEHGRDEVAAKASTSQLVPAVAPTSSGMMIANPPAEGEIFPGLSVEERAEFLREAASPVWLTKDRRTKRGPKKPRPKLTSGKINDHVATARLLNELVQQK